MIKLSPPPWKPAFFALALSASGLQAQTFNSVSLRDLLLAAGAEDPATQVTSFGGLIPGTGITVQATTSQPVYASTTSGSPAIVWSASSVDPESTALTNDWTITLTGGVAQDVRFVLVDFDWTPAGSRESLTNLGPELGAPSFLQTVGATNNAQMTYTTDFGGQISHPVQLPDTGAGDATVDWYDVNLSSFSFTVERNTEILGNGFNLYIGEIPPVPEPSAATLTLLCGALMLGRRRRN